MDRHPLKCEENSILRASISAGSCEQPNSISPTHCLRLRTRVRKYLISFYCCIFGFFSFSLLSKYSLAQCENVLQSHRTKWLSVLFLLYKYIELGSSGSTNLWNFRAYANNNNWLILWCDVWDVCVWHIRMTRALQRSHMDKRQIWHLAIWHFSAAFTFSSLNVAYIWHTLYDES